MADFHCTKFIKRDLLLRRGDKVQFFFNKYNSVVQYVDQLVTSLSTKTNVPVFTATDYMFLENETVDQWVTKYNIFVQYLQSLSTTISEIPGSTSMFDQGLWLNTLVGAPFKHDFLLNQPETNSCWLTDLMISDPTTVDLIDI